MSMCGMYRMRQRLRTIIGVSALTVMGVSTLPALAVAAQEPPALEPIAEVEPGRLQQSYRRVVLELEGAGPQRKGLQITVGVLGGKPVQIWTLSPVWGSQRLISRLGSLEATDGGISGTCYVLISSPYVDKSHYKAHKHGGDWWQFTLQASTNNGRFKGAWSGQHSNPERKERAQAKGAVTGHTISRKELEARHPFFADADYPFWRGRSGNGSTPDTGCELVEDLSNATLLWASEEWELPGTYNIVMGGIGGPVVADGRVYLSYQMPNGPTFDEQWYEKLMPDGAHEESRVSYYGHLADDYGAEWLRRRTSVEADDVILCVDAPTGLTIWKRVFPAVARNPSYSGRGFSWAKNGPYTTPCVADGKLFTIGGHGAIYCLDARTGETVWTNGLPSSSGAKKHLAAAVQQGRMVQRVKHDPRAPDYVTSLIYADGVIVASDNGWSVTGYDAASGRKLWGGVKVEGLGNGRGGGAHSGVLITLDDRTYVVMGPALMDPRTGDVLWNVPAKYFRGELGNPCVAGDIVVFANGIRNRDSDIGLSAWRVTPQGGELLWTLDDSYCTTGFQTPTVYDGHLYSCTRSKNGKQARVICVELETGKTVGEVAGKRGEGSIACLLAADDRLLVGQQGGSWWRADPANFERLCEFPGGDSVANNQSSHPQAMCGARLYSRGDFNLVCWDLRRTQPPRFEPDGGKIANPVDVRLIHPAADAVIRYAFDGDEPTADSPVLMEPLRIAETRIVKAKAFRPGIAPSKTVQAVYYFGESDVAVAPSIEPAGGSYDRDLTVRLESPTRYATIRYTLDGSTPTADSRRYEEPFIVARSTAVNAKTFCGYLPDSTVVSAEYKINREPFIEEDGRIVMEAENFFTQKQAEDHQWRIVDGEGAGGKLVDAQPDRGKKYKDAKGPRLDYPLLVSQPGTYYVWARWSGRGGSSDSMYVGLDRKCVGDFGQHSGALAWQRLGEDQPRKIRIDKPGQHTFHMWMREDGTRVDKLILTQDADWKPLIPAGPPQSPKRRAD